MHFNFKPTLLIVFLIIGLAGCDVLEQASEATRLSKCEFRIHSVRDLDLAGIDIQNMDSYTDLGLFEAGKLTAAVLQGYVPLKFTLNVQSKNPNDKLAALNKLDWILHVDDIEMTRGVLNERIEIAPNGGQTMIPLSISVDLLEILSGDSGEAVKNFGFNLAGTGDKPTRIMIKLKPTVYVSGQPIEYPGYIKVKTKFTSL